MAKTVVAEAASAKAVSSRPRPSRSSLESGAGCEMACNDLSTMTVLAIGTDVRPGQHRYGLTDVIRAIRVDFRAPRVTALEFPRYLWVKIPGIEGRVVAALEDPRRDGGQLGQKPGFEKRLHSLTAQPASSHPIAQGNPAL